MKVNKHAEFDSFIIKRTIPSLNSLTTKTLQDLAIRLEYSDGNKHPGIYNRWRNTVGRIRNLQSTKLSCWSSRSLMILHKRIHFFSFFFFQSSTSGIFAALSKNGAKIHNGLFRVAWRCLCLLMTSRTR